MRKTNLTFSNSKAGKASVTGSKAGIAELADECDRFMERLECDKRERINNDDTAASNTAAVAGVADVISSDEEDSDEDEVSVVIASDKLGSIGLKDE